MDSKTKMKVKNRSASMVVYTVVLDNGRQIRREIRPGQPIEVLFEELEKLSYQPGGKSLMANFLQIESTEALEEVGVETEPEYFMTEEQIVALLKTGSMDEFLDCLDFAPEGVIDLLKTYAVQLPLNDSAKREAMKEKLGFDVSKALENMAAEKAAAADETNAPATATASTTSGRRTQPKYKVVSTTN